MILKKEVISLSKKTSKNIFWGAAVDELIQVKPKKKES